MSILLFYIGILVFATLFVILLTLLLFGTIEKNQPRNSLGLPVGKKRYYFIFQNEKIQIRKFMYIFILSAIFLAYLLYKMYA